MFTKFIIGKKEFKTERGICNFMQHAFPTAHEVFINQGDILLVRDGVTLAIAHGHAARGGQVFASPKFVQVPQ